MTRFSTLLAEQPFPLTRIKSKAPKASAAKVIVTPIVDMLGGLVVSHNADTPFAAPSAVVRSDNAVRVLQSKGWAL